MYVLNHAKSTLASYFRDEIDKLDGPKPHVIMREDPKSRQAFCFCMQRQWNLIRLFQEDLWRRALQVYV